MTEQRKKRLKRELQASKYRLNKLNEEFAAPLKEMLFVATKEVKRISTNGACIYFDPDWLQKLNHTSLDFIISHQLMHIALGHIDRPKYYKGDRFHLACDIIANSNLVVLGWKYDKLPQIGRIFHETFFPILEGRSLSAEEAFAYVPFDPATMKPGVNRNFMIDSEIWWDKKEDRGECGIIILRPGEEDEEFYDEEKTTGGSYFYVRKENFEKIEDKNCNKKNSLEVLREISASWDKRSNNEIKSLRSSVNHNSEEGENNELSERISEKMDSQKLNWKKILNIFVQEDICDYSFTPPDRRLQETEFFLPDYNVIDEKPKEVLFMADTSASIADEKLWLVYGEISNALEQFNGQLIGSLGFFDTKVYKPVSFLNVTDLLKIPPLGGGGTDFGVIFEYLRRCCVNNLPSCIVVFTDGDGPYPEQSETMGIPVLWIINNLHNTPPWGKIARVSENAFIDSIEE